MGVAPIFLAGCWSEWGHVIKNTQIENNFCDWLIGYGMFSSLIPQKKPRRWGILRHNMFPDVGQPLIFKDTQIGKKIQMWTIPHEFCGAFLGASKIRAPIFMVPNVVEA